MRFRFENKSLWHFEKRWRFEPSENATGGKLCPHGAARLWNVIDEDMVKKWIRFVVFPVTTSKPNSF